MTDETEQNQAIDMAAKLSQLGVRLKKARESAQLSEKEAASRLHLNVKFIEMMENGKYDEKLPTTFLRGYLRSYARLLHVSEEEVAAMLEQATVQPPITPPPPIMPKKSVFRANTTRNTDRYIRSITYLVAVVLIVLVGIWWNSHSRYSVSDVTSEIADSSTPTENKPATPEPTDNTDNNPLTIMTPTNQAPVLDPSMVPTDATHSDSSSLITITPEVAAPLSSITIQQNDTTTVDTTSAQTDAQDPPAKPKVRSHSNKMRMEHSEPGLEEWSNN